MDLGDVVGVVAEGLRERAARERVELRVEVSPAVVVGDPVLLEHMVGNLLENALRYNEPGAGWVQVEVHDDGRRARVVVANRGPIVASDRLAELWLPFRRLDRSRSRANGGFGLGLSIVRAVAEAHRGSVSARARPQGGLVVEVILPAAVTGLPSSHRDPAAHGTC